MFLQFQSPTPWKASVTVDPSAIDGSDPVAFCGPGQVPTRSHDSLGRGIDNFVTSPSTSYLSVLINTLLLLLLLSQQVNPFHMNTIELH